MLQLNSPDTVIHGGCLRDYGSVLHGELFATTHTESGATIGPDALSQTLLQIDELIRSYLRRGSEDTPSETAHSSVKMLLAEAQLENPILTMPSVIEGSEGDLLLHWDATTKSVVLICPATADKTQQIYKEELDGMKAASSEMVEATPKTLSEALSWVLRPK
jgi:hypothetical protein